MADQVLLQTPDAWVRIMTLDADENGQWHRHTEVAEHVVCLSGGLDLECSEPNEITPLRPGDLGRVAVGRRHRVVNSSATAARYLLVQGPGSYDFVVD
jgi:mannose-6-phosphate isomerase-like protein (cupin superfamily)